MERVKWNIKQRLRVLFCIIMADGAVLGASLGLMRGTMPEAELLPAVQADGGAEISPGKTGQKYVALTFDDGPSKENTQILLDGLKARGVHATFFLMGENINGNEELVRRMKEDGHLIGNHSYRHVQLTKDGIDNVCQSIKETSRILAGITGEEPKYLRPPYGDWNDELAECVDLIPVFWSVDSLDWKYQNADQITRRVLKKLGNGDIILMHDIFPTSVKAALEIVDRLVSEGWRFVTVDELMID